MGRSESVERERKSKKKSRKNRSRSRSRSSSPERSRRKRSRSRERKRSRSREKRRSRSRDRRRSRSGSKDRSHRKESKNSREKSSKRQSSDDDSLTIYNKDTGSSSNLKDKINSLVVKTEVKNEQIIPSFDDISKIESDGFSQANFSSTNTNIPQQTTKKKKKGKKKGKIVDEKSPITGTVPSISHESAIFGNTNDTMHIGKFSSRINNERKEVLKTVKSDDLIFGAMFCEDPEIRMKRWVDKLTTLRQKLSAEIDGEMMVC